MFKMYKFHTMRDITEDLVSDEDRITPFGSWLRSTSLDELPELLNVLKGDMSIVNPRPTALTVSSEDDGRRRHEEFSLSQKI